jgi:valyl-tRNA synthetase
MLGNESFVNNAPKEQVDKAKDELEQMRQKHAQIEASIKDLN